MFTALNNFQAIHALPYERNKKEIKAVKCYTYSYNLMRDESGR